MLADSIEDGLIHLATVRQRFADVPKLPADWDAEIRRLEDRARLAAERLAAGDVGGCVKWLNSGRVYLSRYAI